MIDTNLMKFPEEKVQKLMSHYKEILSLLGKILNVKVCLKLQNA